MKIEQRKYRARKELFEILEYENQELLYLLQCTDDFNDSELRWLAAFREEAKA